MAADSIVVAPSIPTGGTPPAPVPGDVVTNPGGTSSVSVSTTPPAPKVEDSKPVVPDKFKNADGSVNTDALIKSYTELEKTQSAPKTPEPVKTDVEKSLKADDLKSINDEYAKAGKISDETLKKFNLDRGVVDAYIEGQKARVQQYTQQLEGFVGGKESLTKMLEWAGVNLNDNEITTINSGLSSGDADKAKLSLEGLQARFTKAMGTDPSLVTGEGGGVVANGPQPFKSSYEVTEAMGGKNKERYRNDPAYREAVAKRLAVSFV